MKLKGSERNVRNFAGLRGFALTIGFASVLMVLDGSSGANAYGLPGVAVDPVGMRWSGFYLGLHGGFGHAEPDNTAFDVNRVVVTCETGPNSGIPRACASGDRDGEFIGLQFGYNLLATPNLLLGVEFDSSAAGIDKTTGNCAATGCASSEVETDYLGTIRGRLGYVQGNWLIYGTGGVAFTHSNTTRTITNVVNPGAAALLTGRSAEDSGFETGWVAGGGIEWAIFPSLTLKLEYQHLEFSDISRDFRYPTSNPNVTANSFRHTSTDLSIDTVRIGINLLFSRGDRTQPLK